MAVTRSRIYEITNVNTKNENDVVNYILTDVRESQQTRIPVGVPPCYNVYLADVDEEDEEG